MKKLISLVLVLLVLYLTPATFKSLNASHTLAPVKWGETHTSFIGALIGDQWGSTGAIIGAAAGGVLGLIGGAALGNAICPGPGTFLGLNGASWGSGLGTIIGSA